MNNPIEIVAAEGQSADDLMTNVERQLRTIRDGCAGGGPDSIDCYPARFEVDVTDADTMPRKIEFICVGDTWTEFEAHRTEMYVKDGRLWFKYEVQQ